MKKLLLTIVMLVLFWSPRYAGGFPAVEIYEKTSKAVVLITARNKGESSMVGAGSIVMPSGFVVTNAHVVVDKNAGRPYKVIRVFTKPDEVTGNLKKDLVNRHKAKVIAFDAKLDLAFLEVQGLPPDTGMIELADSEEVKTGEEVVAIGHPERGGVWTLTYGRISGQISDQSGIMGKDVFQTDTSVNRGNSGGPLLDRRGYMVGINTNIARLGAGGLPITGVNFAVKSSVVKKWLDGQRVNVAYGKEAVQPVEKVAEDPREASMKSDEFLTPKKPYDYDALWAEVEKEMEDLMEEMKGKIRR
jgi:serine protease Do